MRMRPQWLLGSCVLLIPACATTRATPSAVWTVRFAPAVAVLAGSGELKVLVGSHAPIPEAEVELAHRLSVNRLRGHADERGIAHFPEVPPGDYNVTVGSPGFVRAEHRGLRIMAGEVANVEVQLVPAGPVTIELICGPSLIDLSSMSKGLSMSAEELRGLPLRRALGDRLLLTPGVH